jgi:hypothetical protein
MSACTEVLLNEYHSDSVAGRINGFEAAVAIVAIIMFGLGVVVFFLSGPKSIIYNQGSAVALGQFCSGRTLPALLPEHHFRSPFGLANHKLASWRGSMGHSFQGAVQLQVAQ